MGWTARHNQIAADMRARYAGRGIYRPERFKRRPLKCGYWEMPTGHIPSPTERSYPQSNWQAIEEYARLWAPSSEGLYGSYLYG